MGRCRAIRLRALASDRRGAAAVELALLAPLLLVLLCGLVDASRLILQTMQVNATVQAGVDYALIHDWDAAEVKAAAEDATTLSEQVATPTRDVRCLVNGAVANCASAGSGSPYVTVSASLPFSPVTPGLSGVMPRQLQARAAVRVD